MPRLTPQQARDMRMMNPLTDDEIRRSTETAMRLARGDVLTLTEMREVGRRHHAGCRSVTDLLFDVARDHPNRDGDHRLT